MSDSFHIVCPHCDGINNVPGQRLDDNPLCGKCKEKLFTSNPVKLIKSNFQKHINNNEIPTVVDFWAAWCGPCKMMAPVFEQAAFRLEPLARLAKVNTEEEPELSNQYGIRSIPTIMIFKGGRELTRQPGAMDLETLVNWVKANS